MSDKKERARKYKERKRAKKASRKEKSTVIHKKEGKSVGIIDNNLSIIKEQSTEALKEIELSVRSLSDEDILDRPKVLEVIMSKLNEKDELDEDCKAYLATETLNFLTLFIAKEKSLDLSIKYWARGYWESIQINKNLEDENSFSFALDKIHEIVVSSKDQFEVTDKEFISKIADKNFDDDILQKLFGLVKDQNGCLVSPTQDFEV
jgi:hypothetical protein